MEQPSNSALHVADDQQSTLWEILIPLAAAAVPATAFWVLGFITPRVAKQGDDAPGWVVVSMVCLEMFGIVAMAVVLLGRYDFGSKRLSGRTNGNPPAWRRTTLVLAMAMLLLYDTTVNLAAAFAGGGVLLVLGIPAFFAYLALGRLSLIGLGPAAKSVDRAHQ